MGVVFISAGENRNSLGPNLTRDGVQDQDQESVEDDEHLSLIKRKRSPNKRTPKRLKLLKERSLKRPIVQSIGSPVLEASAEQPDIIFDAETESDSDVNDDLDDLLIGCKQDVHEFDRILADGLPQNYKSLMIFMGASSKSSPNFLLQKRLKKGDVDERRNRLVIPQRKMRNNFLDLEEEEKLNMERWWIVEVIEPDCSVSLMTLSKWETPSGAAYVFITEWNGLVERNELKEGDLVQLWSFRVHGSGGDDDHGRLCFMLLEICEEGDDETDA
ncbi:B3 domain-containing protein, partial [Cucurbita argyrosperma subsp. argyrosperma]